MTRVARTFLTRSKRKIKTEKKLATNQGLILPYVLFPEARLANVIFKIKGTRSRLSACSLIKLPFSNLLLILSVNSPLTCISAISECISK